MLSSCVNFLEEQVAKNGDKVAITDSNDSMTYIEIRIKALKIGSAIGNDLKNKPIGVFLPKSNQCVTAFMGVLYSGNFYVPIDVKSPIERLNSLIENLRPAAIVTQSKYLESFKSSPHYHQIKFIEINELSTQYIDFDYKAIVENVIETDPIYTIYTSGSTGAVSYTHLSCRRRG